MLKNIPDWLKKKLEEEGNEIGIYSFQDGAEVTLADLPDEFVGIASGENSNGLAVSKKSDGVVYRFENNEIDVFAIDEIEFEAAVARDIAWEELSENMPSTNGFWLGIVFKTKTEEGKILTLGFKGEARHSALVVRGKVEPGDMLTDALDRELLETLNVDDYQVLDVVDDGGTVASAGIEEALFTVMVEVEQFDVYEKIQEQNVGWLDLDQKKIAN